ncbi:zinc ribbon domain-containing protein [Variovorax humicola]|uniref:Zinc ribbon domain-containing protein n=1 Tax=Variovorax humicola TaxID=1769758 RepID=A0ABU8VVC6_9BURK
MVNLADFSDTSLLEPCKHCGELLQERERFCPFCGTDRTGADGARDPRYDVEVAIEHGVGRSLATYEVDYPLMDPQEPSDVTSHPVPSTAIMEEVGSNVGFVRPGVPWRRNAAGEGRVDWADSGITPNRLVLGIAASLVGLLAFAFAFDHFYLDKQREDAKLREFKMNVEMVRSALKSGDLVVAERGLEVLDTDHANNPTVQSLQQTLDRKLQEQRQSASVREEVPDNVADAPAAAPAPVAAAAVAPTAATVAAPAVAPEPPAPPAATVVVPKIAVREPASAPAAAGNKVCSDALAALALCAKR